MSDKPRFYRSDAIEVAREMITLLAPLCVEIIVAGSLRRRKAEVGDVEIIFIPQTRQVSTDLFGGFREESIVDERLPELIERGILAKRPNKDGVESWGVKNKLARHVRSGIPVDLFAATRENWWNYVVCRTGGSRTNIAICQGAQRKGWKWNTYGEGFSRPKGLEREYHPIATEREVFEFAGLEYKEPWERE